MFTTKYSKSPLKAAVRVKKYQEGGKVEKEFDTIRSPEGATTLIRKGRSPQDYYGVSARDPRNLLAHAGASKTVADITRKNPRRPPGSRQILDEYEDD